MASAPSESFAALRLQGLGTREAQKDGVAMRGRRDELRMSSNWKSREVANGLVVNCFLAHVTQMPESGRMLLKTTIACVLSVRDGRREE